MSIARGESGATGLIVAVNALAGSRPTSGSHRYQKRSGYVMFVRGGYLMDSKAKMKVLVACECSGRVKTAFRERGHDAWSCDLKPSEIPDDKFHIQGDVLPLLNSQWDLMIAHPPCTYLSYVGMRHWNKQGRSELREQAMVFFMRFVNAPIERIAIENPLGYAGKAYRKHDQIIQPYYFGDRFLKRTCLWLKNLPKLYWQPCDDMIGRQTATEYPEPMAYLKTTGKAIHWTEYMHGRDVRSKSWNGIANAMAEQWGCLTLSRGV